jgi:hypothetical protein
LRTLVIGMLLAMTYGAVSAFGDMANVDFFSKTGWISAITLAVGAAVSAGISYLARLKVAPNYEQT